MEEGLVYVVFMETGDYYQRHNISYAGTDKEHAFRIMLSSSVFTDNYTEVWSGETFVETIWAHEVRKGDEMNG